MTGAYDALVVEAPAAGHGVLTGYGNWRFVAEAAVPNQTLGRFDEDTFDDDTFSDGWQWQDVTSLWRGAQWNRGSAGFDQRPQVGTATLTLANNDGLLSKWNADSTWPGAPTYLGPGLLVRMGWHDQVASTWVPAFTGLIDEAEGEAAELDADQWITWSLVETTSVLALIDNLEQPALGSGETVFQRLERLTDEAGWQYGLGSNFGGSFINPTVQGTTLAGNRLTEAYLTGDTGFLDVLSDRAGRFDTWAKGYVTPWVAAGATLRLGFTEVPVNTTISAASYRLLPWEKPPRIVETKVGMYNAVAVGRVGGTAVGYEDQASVGLNGRSSTQRTDLIADSDTDLPEWADLFLGLFADRTLAMGDITLNPDQDATGFAALVALDLGLQVVVIRRTPRVTSGWADTLFACALTGYQVNVTPARPSRANATAFLHLDVQTYLEV